MQNLADTISPVITDLNGIRVMRLLCFNPVSQLHEIM